MTDNIKLQDISVMKSDCLFQITRNTGSEEWLHSSNYRTPRSRRV